MATVVVVAVAVIVVVVIVVAVGCGCMPLAVVAVCWRWCAGLSLEAPWRVLPWSVHAAQAALGGVGVVGPAALALWGVQKYFNT